MLRPLLICAALALLGLTQAGEGAAQFYQKKATWFETYVASWETACRQHGDEAKGAPLPDFGKEPFTILAWVKTQEGGTILAKAPATGKWAPQGKSLFVRDGKLCYDIGWVACLQSHKSIADNQWHHVALTGPKDYEFYIDGKLDLHGGLGAEPDKPEHVAKIGCTSDDFPAVSHFKGALDDLRVYKRRLTADEVQNDFEKPGAAGNQDQLAAHWKFDGNTDDATGGHSLALPKGQEAAYCEGKVGQALTLNGSACLNVPPSRAGALREEVWALVKRDFVDARSVRELQREAQDKILDDPWKPGDCAALAARYARATRVPGLAEQAREAAAKANDAAGLECVREIYHRSRGLEDAQARLAAFNTKALRAAVADLAASFGPRYPRGAELLAQLDALEKPLSEPANPDYEAALTRAAEELPRLRHEALIAQNPLLDFGRLLFVRRKTYQSSHYYTEYIDGCKFYGGNLCILDLKSGKVTDVAPQLSGGIFGRFDLSYDATRVVFDFKKGPGKGFRIYEIGIDGQGLRQLTSDPADEQELVKKFRTVGTPTGLRYDTGTDDMHPCYLPEGDIVFISTRCKKGILCDGPDVLTTTNLYRMDKDGQNMRPLSFNSVSETTPSILQDGRILYTRWEYVDKGGSACKCIWAMHPDGSGSVEVYANNIAHPTTRIDARDIPGVPNAYVFVGAPHMPLGVGAVIRLDTRYSLRGTKPMTSLTPEIYCPDEHGFQHFRNGKWVHDLEGPLFREPYPLSYKYFLVAYNPDKPWNEVAGYGLYLLDEFGNRELIYKDPEFSCWEPYPLRPRERPLVLPDTAPGNAGVPPAGSAGVPPATGASATLVLQDVYLGLTGIERGRVKYLRVMEDCPRPWEARRRWPGDEIGQQHVAVSWGGHLAVKIEHGVVPVAADGSAYFTAPAGKNIFFQALDENYMELQRMRTFVNLLPGEVRGCAGCHEEKAIAPRATSYPAALRTQGSAGVPPASEAGGTPALRTVGVSPATPVAQPGETVPRAMHYVTDVQPVLDKHCVSCHSAAKPNGIDLSGTLTELFSVSYENLLKKRWAGNVIDEIGISGTGGKHAHIEATDPLVYGSHTSKLIALLRKGHYEVKLPQEDFIRLVTWMDANAPYYGAYDGRRNLRFKDLPDFRPAPKAGPQCTAFSGAAAEK
ncbi:MAG: LamG-like jellyroll fold domain-containing protein [Planctomycetota bacterium]